MSWLTLQSYASPYLLEMKGDYLIEELLNIGLVCVIISIISSIICTINNNFWKIEIISYIAGIISISTLAILIYILILVFIRIIVLTKDE